MKPTCLIIGGGAAGFFAAIQCASLAPYARVLILEGARRTLTKVKISGGGRCNVTHGLFDIQLLRRNYPRGDVELVSAFHRFNPQHTFDWFQSRGVPLKIEADGRAFPTSDSSQSIIDCLKGEADRHGVELLVGQIVQKVVRASDRFLVQTRDQSYSADCVLLATGSSPSGHRLAADLGHRITALAPSLFTFKVDSPLLAGLPGVALATVAVSILDPANGKPRFREEGPLLITHWGLSGPVILRLSAFAARELQDWAYRAPLRIDFLPGQMETELQQWLQNSRAAVGAKLIRNVAPPEIPKRLWQRMCELSGLSEESFDQLSRAHSQALVTMLKRSPLEVLGKGEFKEEFVTCGGIDRKDVDFRTMESKFSPGLYFAGEILDIDGITGGFNFQAAWTGGYLAGRAMADRLSRESTPK